MDKNSKLYKAYRTEKDNRSLRRIHACTVTETAEIVCHSTETVQSWLDRFEECGIAALRDHARTGRPSKVDEKIVRTIMDAALHDHLTSPEKIRQKIHDVSGVWLSLC